METCGAVADMDKVTGKLTIWCTTQAPHAHRTLYALVAGLPEHKIRVISPDIGGGFGNKVGIYPGYVLAVVGSIVTGKPVKWVEDRSENLMSTSFARDYHMHGEIAATRDGKILGLRVDVLADHGAFNNTAQPTKFPAGFFHIFTGSYDYPAAHCTVKGVYTNKAPGGVAYACSFRVTEAVYLVERIVDCLADELDMDPAELRMKNLLRPEQFPYTSPTGWEYDSGDYPRALQMAMDIAGYEELRREQAEKRARGELMGIGVSFFTEAVGAGPRKHMDILGLGMADGAEVRVHPTGKAVVRLSVQTQGQGHETTFAQIVSEVTGIPPEDIEVVHGDTDNTPFGLGTYGSRSTPVSGAAVAVAAQAGRGQGEDHRRGDAGGRRPTTSSRNSGTFSSRATRPWPRRSRRSRSPRTARWSCPKAWRATSTRPCVYDPPNLTYPFGAYICVVDVDAGTGVVQGAAVHRRRRLRPAHQPDDRRGADARRAGRRHRHGADGGHRVRRGRQLPRRVVHGLPAADGDGVPELGAGRDGDAVAAPPARREGRRRVGHRRFAGRRGQCRDGRAQAVRRAPRRHAAHPGPGVAGDAGPAVPDRPGDHGLNGVDHEAGAVATRIELAARAAALAAGGTPFVWATVVRAERPTSAKAGRLGARARRRRGRRVRRRRVRGVDGARPGAGGARDRYDTAGAYHAVA